MRVVIVCHLRKFSKKLDFQGSKVVIEFVGCPGNPVAKHILTFQFLSKRHQNQRHLLSLKNQSTGKAFSCYNVNHAHYTSRITIFFVFSQICVKQSTSCSCSSVCAHVKHTHSKVFVFNEYFLQCGLVMQLICTQVWHQSCKTFLLIDDLNFMRQ